MSLFAAARGYVLPPDQILVIANSDSQESVQIAEYYCARRNVPTSNVLALPLEASLNDTISRARYEKNLAEPIRKRLSSTEPAGKIKCLLTTYGVPIRVGGRGPLRNYESELNELKELTQLGKARIEQLEQAPMADSTNEKEEITHKLALLEAQIDWIEGKETGACVDSELSMVLAGDYELYRWQPNRLKNGMRSADCKTLMVCRIDGPSFEIARNLVDKAIIGEKMGLIRGKAYIDSRGIKDDKKDHSFGHFDQSLRDLAELIKSRTSIAVQQEETAELFAPGECPYTSLYCGWYSLRNYVDAFDFINGAIGYHISSLEAVDLRDPNSSQWCPAMLKDGITATLGAVAEPYLHSFPEPKAFFLELLDGHCLVEAYYRTKPFNSWQLVLIGDPLYTPFKKP